MSGKICVSQGARTKMFAFDEDVGNSALASHVFESCLDVLAIIALVELIDIGVNAEISEERLSLGTEGTEGLAEDDDILRTGRTSIGSRVTWPDLCLDSILDGESRSGGGEAAAAGARGHLRQPGLECP